MVEKRFEESRSRSPKDCVHRGLGLRLNKQKNHSFCGSGMDGFSHLYYRCIACQYYTKLGIILASNAYGAPYAKALISAKVEMRVFCLLRLCPNPRRTQFCVLETLEKSSSYAILQIAKWASTPVLFRFSRHGESIVSKNPIYICLCSLKGTHIIPCLLVLCVHGFFLRQELGIFCLQALNGGQLFQPLLIKGLLVSLRRRIALVLPQKLRNLLCSSRAVEFQIT